LCRVSQILYIQGGVKVYPELSNKNS